MKSENIITNKLKAIFLVLLFSILIVGIDNAQAQNPLPYDQLDINAEPSKGTTRGGFQLVICDGPTLPKGTETTSKYLEEFRQSTGREYVACDFNGLMRQIQHLLNAMLIIGILAAIFGMAWAGGLYITGVEKDINQAKSMFPKIIIGFIIMLSAWFIVYQLIEWTKNRDRTDNFDPTVLIGDKNK